MTKSLSSLSEIIKSMPVPEKVENKTISHSQYTIYKACPHQWQLRYVQKIRPFSGSIHTVFGTAMHETLQEYFRVMYTVSIKAADDIDMEELLMTRFLFNYEKEIISNEGIHFSTEEEFLEFYNDGLLIIHWLKGHRAKFFSTRGYQLLGIEIPIMQPTDVNPKIYIKCFLDMVLGDTDLKKIIIYDFKTSTRGWKDDREKKDPKKIAQILWYKKYFAKQYEVSEDDIEVVFFILKRKIWEQAEFPQPRVQVFRPAAGVQKMKAAEYEMQKFVEECFTPEGEYNTERDYPKTPSTWSCKYCPFLNDDNLCDKQPS